DELFRERRKKLDALRAMGINPFGNRIDGIQPVQSARVKAERLSIPQGQTTEETARLAGRIVLLRVMGKLAFLQLRDSSGDIQIGISQKEVGPAGWALLQLLDLGDLIATEGPLGRTKTNEITLWAKSVTLLTKCLRTPPEKWHGLTDVDQRYRHRYVD